jgi:hypothetical protein
MYRFVFVYKARDRGKWNRQLGRFRYKMVVKDYLRILSIYSRCNYSHSNLRILCIGRACESDEHGRRECYASQAPSLPGDAREHSPVYCAFGRNGAAA